MVKLDSLDSTRKFAPIYTFFSNRLHLIRHAYKIPSKKITKLTKHGPAVKVLQCEHCVSMKHLGERDNKQSCVIFFVQPVSFGKNVR